MSSIKLSPGTLSPPACYDTEQARFEAYVGKIVATILGGLQWETQQTAPVDLGLYWLRQNSDGRSRGARKYNTTDARWIPWLETLVIPDSSGGSANAYTVTTGHSMVSGAVRISGRRFLCLASATNTGASTLDVDGIGAIQITRHGAAALQAGDIVLDQFFQVVFNAAGGGRFELATPVPPIANAESTYVSVSGAIPAAGASLDLPHGQFTAPEFVDLVLECTSTDRGYSVGDQVSIGSFFWSGGNTGIPAFTIERDATNVRVIRSSSVVVVHVAPKGGGAAYDVAADMTKWTIKGTLQFIP